MQTKKSNEEEIISVESGHKNEKKKNKLKIVLEVALFTLGALLLTSCSPAKADGSIQQSSSPSFTPTITRMVSPTPTATPEPTPSPTPQITREEALSKMNITSDKLYSYFELIVYECTLRDGTKFNFLGIRLMNNMDNNIKIYNVLDNELYGIFPNEVEVLPQVDYMKLVDIELVPDFLQGATIDATYGVCSISYISTIRNEEIPKSKYFDYILKYTSPGEDPYVLAEENLTALDCANILLDLYSYEEIALPSTSVTVSATPKTK